MRFAKLIALCVAATLFAAIGPTEAAAQRDDELRLRDLRIDSRRPRQPEEGTGVIVVSARSLAAATHGGSATIARLAASADLAASAGGFSVSTKSGRGRNDSRLRQYEVYQAPPGRYVLLHFSSVPPGTTSLPGRQYCFGTIGFELAAGDVLYIGDFVGLGIDPIIDFDLEDARRVLAPLPALQAAVRPASYSENIEFACNWAEMARFQLSDADRARLVAGGALPAPAGEPTTGAAETVAAVAEEEPTADASVSTPAETAPVPDAPTESTDEAAPLTDVSPSQTR